MKTWIIKLFSRPRRFWLDLCERVLWTSVQAVLGLIVVDQLDLPPAYVPIVAGGLAAVKGWVAGQLGDRTTASTLPADVDRV